MVDLAQHLQLTKAAVTKIVDVLEAGRFVKRVRDDGDRRVVRVRLTPAGSDALARAERVFEAVIFEGLWGVLSEREAVEAARILGKAESLLGLTGAVLPPG